MEEGGRGGGGGRLKRINMKGRKGGGDRYGGNKCTGDRQT